MTADDLEALAKAHHRDCVLHPGSGVYRRDDRGWDAISPKHQEHHRAHVELMRPAIVAALNRAIELAAKAVETTENRMGYGPGVEDFTVAAVEQAIEAVKTEAAERVRALAVP